MVYFAVVDTNVLVSGLIKTDSYPGMVLKKVLNGEIIPLVSEEIILEYYEVLNRSKFGFSKDVINLFFEEFIKKMMVLPRTITDMIFVDEDDRAFYEVLITSRIEVESYLITGNIKHFPISDFIVTPKQMINIIDG